MNKNFYDILGVSKNATEQEIKTAFRKISKENHPDLQVGKTEQEQKAAEARFKEAAEAYETLSNKEKRQQYDLTSESPFSSAGFGGSQSSFFRNSFSSFFGNNPGFGHNPFNSQPNKAPDPNSPEDGRNVQIRLDVSFKESLFGVTKEFDINIEDVCDDCHGTGVKNGGNYTSCPHCHGTGMLTQQQGNVFMQSTCMYCNGVGYINSNPCTKCHGSKRIPKKKHISIKIPAGVDTGNKLRVQNAGQSGINGGTNGDLYIIVNVLSSDLFKRSRNDLETTVYISPIVASIGGTLDVYTPYGTTTIKIPAGTKNGQRFQIRGKGIKSQNGAGNLYAIVEIEPLVNLTADQIQMLKDLNATIQPSNLKKSLELHKKLESVFK